MAVTWRTYSSTVAVSAALIIGGKLWYERPDGHIMGEDMAELLAAANERDIAMNDYAHQSTINYVRAFAEKSNLQAILTKIRDTIQGGNTEYSFYPAGHIYWVDPYAEFPASGDAISQAYSTKTVYNTYTNESYNGRKTEEWIITYGDVSEYCSMRTLDTRIPPTNTDLPFNKYTYSSLYYGAYTNVPMVENLHSGDHGEGGVVLNIYLDYYFNGFGNWWTFAMADKGVHFGLWQTNLYSFMPIEKIMTNSWGVAGYAVASSLIETNNFNAARAIMGLMNQTIYFPHSCTYTQQHYFIFSDSYDTGWTTNEIAEVDVLSALRMSVLTNNSFAVLTNGAGYGGIIISAKKNIETWNLKDEDTSLSNVYYSKYASFNGSSYHLYGIDFGYPSQKALTNNLVSRVRHYAIITGTPAWPTTPVDLHTNSTYYGTPPEEYTITYSYTWDSVTANYYNNYSSLGMSKAIPGVIIKVSEQEDFSPVSNITEENILKVSGWVSEDYIEQSGLIYWTLIYDSGSNPTNIPKFDFAPSLTNWDGILSNIPATGTPYNHFEPWQRVETVSTDYNIYPSGEDRTDIETDNRGLFNQSVSVRFIVVVDWNWKHLNPTTPFVPTNYTPAWVTANTNSP